MSECSYNICIHHNNNFHRHFVPVEHNKIKKKHTHATTTWMLSQNKRTKAHDSLSWEKKMVNATWDERKPKWANDCECESVWQNHVDCWKNDRNEHFKMCFVLIRECVLRCFIFCVCVWYNGVIRLICSSLVSDMYLHSYRAKCTKSIEIPTPWSNWIYDFDLQYERNGIKKKQTLHPLLIVFFNDSIGNVGTKTHTAISFS